MKQWELETGELANECPAVQRDLEVQPVPLLPHEPLNAWEIYLTQETMVLKITVNLAPEGVNRHRTPHWQKALENSWIWAPMFLCDMISHRQTEALRNVRLVSEKETLRLTCAQARIEFASRVSPTPDQCLPVIDAKFPRDEADD